VEVRTNSARAEKSKRVLSTHIDPSFISTIYAISIKVPKWTGKKRNA